MGDAVAIGAVTETAIGFAGVALTDAGIRYATLLHATEAAAWRDLKAHGARQGEHPLKAKALAALRDYGAGNREALMDFPVDLPECSPVQAKTWLALREIPSGETRSYGWLAERVGLGRGGARAVGTMNGDNPIPLWLPCHRVIASDGTLGGFGGGLAMKQKLLELEGALPKRML